ncbi:hypothetical protein NQZ68_033588 [Dissostichus eleginoides]|nr:hypothetical protein NQZ68_033588 [Dissostichus eleginoides]
MVAKRNGEASLLASHPPHPFSPPPLLGLCEAAASLTKGITTVGEKEGFLQLYLQCRERCGCDSAQMVLLLSLG